jgi:hypothetical protein
LSSPSDVEAAAATVALIRDARLDTVAHRAERSRFITVDDS